MNITQNYFYGNSSTGAITIFDGVRLMNISENYFVNNTAFDYSIVFIDQPWEKSFNCNHFIGNSVAFPSTSIVNIRIGNGPGEIRNNIFENNSTSTDGAIVIGFLSGNSTNPSIFDNNYFINNTAPSICSFIVSTTAQSLSEITRNTYSNNFSDSDVRISTIGVNTYPGYLNFKFNNFTDPGIKIKLSNGIAFGAASYTADSNYWNGTSAAYMDSVIYDYFDDPNRAAIYVSHAFANEVATDSSCNSISTGIEPVNPIHSFDIFPNPVIQQMNIRFNDFIHKGRLVIYNMFGQICHIKSMSNCTEITEDLSFLSPGIYILSVESEKNTMVKKFILSY